MIHALVRSNIYSDFMQPARIDRLNFRRMIQVPAIYERKEAVPVALYGEMVANPILNDNGQIRPLGANVDRLSCIQLDYDDGKTIDEFVTEFDGKFRFALYTSYNYGFKPNDRFRVIIPLESPFPCSECNQYFTKAMDSIFHCDVSCWSRGHMQCVPAVRSRIAPYRYYLCDRGPYFKIPWNLVQNEKEKAMAIFTFNVALQSWWDRCDNVLGIRRDEPDPEAMRQAALKWAQEQFDQCPVGSRNNTMFSVLSWLKSKGVTGDQVFMLTPPIGISDEYDKMIERIFYNS